MTAPNKAPAKATSQPTPKPAEKTVEKAAPALTGLAALSLVDAAAPKRVGGSGRKAEDNSVAEGWLKASWDAREKHGKNKLGQETYLGKGKALPPLDGKTARQVVNRLRTAAKTLGIGVTVDPANAGDIAEDAKDVVVTFAAKTAHVPGAGRKPNKPSVDSTK